MATDNPDPRGDVESLARAMTPGQRRRHLIAAGWRTTSWLCPADPEHRPERWYRPGETARHTLGAAIRTCLTGEDQ